MWQKIIGNNKQRFIICVVLLAIGFVNILTNYNMCRFFHPKNMVIAFIPFVISVILFITFLKKDIKVRTLTITYIIFSVFSIILLVVNFINLTVIETTTVNNDVNNYDRTMRAYWNISGVKVFPSEIPEDSENVKFEEIPQSNQIGSNIYLSYNINEENALKIDADIRSKSAFVFENLDDIKNAGRKEVILENMSSYIGYDSKSESSDNFTIYILGIDKLIGTGKVPKELGYGIIINKDENKILYFSEFW